MKKMKNLVSMFLANALILLARISTLTGFRTLLGLGQTLPARICNPCVDNGTDYKSAPAGKQLKITNYK